MTIYENWIKESLENYIQAYSGKNIEVTSDDAKHFAHSVLSYIKMFCIDN